MDHNKHDQAHVGLRNAPLYLLKREEIRTDLDGDVDTRKRVSDLINGINISMFIYTKDTPTPPVKSRVEGSHYFYRCKECGKTASPWEWGTPYCCDSVMTLYKVTTTEEEVC